MRFRERIRLFPSNWCHGLGSKESQKPKCKEGLYRGRVPLVFGTGGTGKTLASSASPSVFNPGGLEALINRLGDGELALVQNRTQHLSVAFLQALHGLASGLFA